MGGADRPDSHLHCHARIFSWGKRKAGRRITMLGEGGGAALQDSHLHCHARISSWRKRKAGRRITMLEKGEALVQPQGTVALDAAPQGNQSRVVQRTEGMDVSRDALLH